MVAPGCAPEYRNGSYSSSSPCAEDSGTVGAGAGGGGGGAPRGISAEGRPAGGGGGWLGTGGGIALGAEAGIGGGRDGGGASVTGERRDVVSSRLESRACDFSASL